MSPLASRRGLPTFSDSRRDSSSKRSRTCWPRSQRRRPRLLGSMSLQSGDSKARLAASTAASTSSLVPRSEEHTSELQSHSDLVCRLLLEKKKTNTEANNNYTALHH